MSGPETGEGAALQAPRPDAGEGSVTIRPLPGRWILHVVLLAEDELDAMRLGNAAAGLLADGLGRVHASATEVSLEHDWPSDRQSVFCGTGLEDGYRCDLQPGHQGPCGREIRLRIVPDGPPRNERPNGTA